MAVVNGTGGQDLIHVAGDPAPFAYPEPPYNDIDEATDDNDDINAGGGDDVIVTGQGEDIVDGGDGDDLIMGGINFLGTALTAGAEVRGSSDDYETVGGDTLSGGAGNDYIFTGYGTLVNGGAGVDTVFVELLIQTVHWVAGSLLYTFNDRGILVDLAQADTGQVVLEVGGLGDLAVTLQDVEAFDITFGSGADTVFGGRYGDNFRGESYNFPSSGDILHGGGGNDTLDGSGGGDTLYGDAGADYLITGVNSPGFDDDTGDTVDGGTGNDTIEARHLDSIDGGAHIDTLVLGPFTPMTIDLSITTAQETAEDLFSTFVNIENIIGAEFEADRLFGNGVANRLEGRGGADTLGGAGGLDTLVGGDDDDTYVNPGTDLIVEFGGGGVDTVLSDATFTLSGRQHVENLTLTGQGNTNASGNSYANLLRGNGGNNDLNGSTGVDTMEGGAGADTYHVDSASDVVTELFNNGVDTILSTVDRTLSANVENLTLQGADSLAGNGNTGANLITGNSGANVLRGYEGADTLLGGAGADILLGGTATDTLDVGVDSARDIVRYSGAESTGSLRDLILNLDLEGEDRLDFAVVPTVLNSVTTGALNLATINADLATAVNGALDPGGAVLFDPSSGDLNQMGHVFVVVDANNNGSYAANVDYLVELVNPTGSLTLDDFM